MSTYYQFACKRCHLMGGSFTRQAAGAGNADLIDTFKFIMRHAMECGTAYIKMVSEHETDYTWPDTNMSGSIREKHLQDTADIFPNSEDWAFMIGNSGLTQTECNKAWIENEFEQGASEEEE